MRASTVVGLLLVVVAAGTFVLAVSGQSYVGWYPSTIPPNQPAAQTSTTQTQTSTITSASGTVTQTSTATTTNSVANFNGLPFDYNAYCAAYEQYFAVTYCPIARPGATAANGAQLEWLPMLLPLYSLQLLPMYAGIPLLVDPQMLLIIIVAVTILLYANRDELRKHLK